LKHCLPHQNLSEKLTGDMSSSIPVSRVLA
jgi:hypothetical protein